MILYFKRCWSSYSLYTHSVCYHSAPGNDCTPWLCYIRHYDPWCSTYHAWWQIFAYSCSWWRSAHILLSLKFPILVFILSIWIFLPLWTDGRVAACLDVLQLTHAAISMVSLSMAHALPPFCMKFPSSLGPSNCFLSYVRLKEVLGLQMMQQTQ
jgi:hypothetical protein